MNSIIIPLSHPTEIDVWSADGSPLPLTLPVDIGDHEDPDTLAARVVRKAIELNFRLQIRILHWLTPIGPIRYVSHISTHQRHLGGFQLQFALRQVDQPSVTLSKIQRSDFLAELDTTTVEEDVWTIPRGRCFRDKDPVVDQLQKIYCRLSENGNDRWENGLYQLDVGNVNRRPSQYIYEAVGDYWTPKPHRALRSVWYYWEKKDRQIYCQCVRKYIANDLPLYISCDVPPDDLQRVRAMFCRINPAIKGWQCYTPKWDCGIIDHYDNPYFKECYRDDFRQYPKVQFMPVLMSRPLHADEFVCEDSWP